MTRSLRMTMWILAMASLVACSYLFWNARDNRRHREAQVHAREMRAQAVRLEVARIFSTLQTHVAFGNTLDWSNGVDQPLADVKQQVIAWRDDLPDGQAKEEVRATESALDALGQNATQLREFLRNNQRTLATEVAFDDGAEIVETIDTHLQAAERFSGADHVVAITTAQQRELYTVFGFGVLALLLLAGSAVPAFRSDRTVLEPVADTSVPSSPARAMPLDAEVPASDGPPPAQPPPGPAPQVADTAPASVGVLPEIGDIAKVCTELARINDPRELGGILERTIQLLDAKGLILWLWNPETARLRAVLARGYDARALGRLPAIAKDELNPAARAFRTGELQVVGARDGMLGVIVAPLLSSSGCVGVMTTELRAGREALTTMHAMSRILAAQLATMVSGAPANETSNAKAAEHAL